MYSLLLETAEHGITALYMVVDPLKAVAITPATLYLHSTSKILHTSDFSRAYDGPVISLGPWVQSTNAMTWECA